jgi:hypothetical protein
MGHMKQLKFDSKKNLVTLGDTVPKKKDYDLEDDITCAFGNIVCELEEKFGIDDYTSIDYVVGSIWDKEQGSLFNSKYEEIYGFPVRRSILTAIFSYISDKEFSETEITLDMIEKIRIAHDYRAYPIPLDITNEEKGYCFNVENFNDIVFSILYYYAKKKLKIRRCVHCGRFFATKSFKTEYCPRNSSAKDYNHLQCKDAAHSWALALQARKKAIRSNWSNYYPEKVEDLLNTCNTLLEVKSIENLTKLENYLYSSDMPKPKNTNRKKGL